MLLKGVQNAFLYATSLKIPGGPPLIIKPRLAAAHSLEKILVKKQFSNVVTAEWLNKTDWSSEDQGLFLRLVYGTLEQIMLIDSVLQKHAARSITGIDSSVRGILRISAYQILFADRIPAYAVINEAVGLIKMEKPKAAGFVNAVLRSIVREIAKATDREAFLQQIYQQQPSLRYSHPEWLIQRLRQDYTQENVIKILESHQKPPILTIRLNLLKGSTEILSQKIGQDGFEIKETGWLPEAYQVTRSSGLITRSAAYHNGLFQIQSIVSMLAVHWLDPQPGEKIIDVAAAPGGKTTFIAQRMKNRGVIMALDLSEKRIRQVDIHARRLGCQIIRTLVKDGRTPDHQWKDMPTGFCWMPPVPAWE
jgi:16S rRNA (cytosine967-C5)-methyltransferase